MPKTQAAVVTEVRSRIDEPTAGVASEVELRTWINEAAKDIARTAECLRAKGSVAVTAGTQAYTAPTDVVRILRVEYKADGNNRVVPLEHRQYNAMDSVWGTWQTMSSNTPSYYTTWGYAPTLTLTVYPTPTTDGDLFVYYAKYPADLATDGSDGTDNVDVPNGWEDVLCDYVEYRYWLKDGRTDNAQRAKAVYDENLMKLIAATTTYVDAPGMITHDSWPTYSEWEF